MEQTEYSETSAYKIQMRGNYPEESIQHSEHCRKFEISKTYFVKCRGYWVVYKSSCSKVKGSLLLYS